jgi:hypothetical protein
VSQLASVLNQPSSRLLVFRAPVPVPSSRILAEEEDGAVDGAVDSGPWALGGAGMRVAVPQSAAAFEEALEESEERGRRMGACKLRSCEASDWCIRTVLSVSVVGPFNRELRLVFTSPCLGISIIRRLFCDTVPAGSSAPRSDIVFDVLVRFDGVPAAFVVLSNLVAIAAGNNSYVTRTC